MTKESSSDLEDRVLILAPIGKDGTMTQSVLDAAGIRCSVCPDLSQLVLELERGAAAAIVAEEAISGEHRETIVQHLARQPPWSDLPWLVLARPGVDSPAVTSALDAFGNVTLLERPIRVATLVSSVKTALRGRRRQYQTRAYLQERERIVEALKDADRRKDAFLAMLAHELRNPLAPISTSLQTIELCAGDNPALQRIREVMERQVRQLIRLVDDLLEVSRITRGKIRLRREPVELRGVIENAVETSRPLIEAKGHELTIDLPPEPVMLDGDPVRLSQAFANLLNNAAKYCDDAGEIAISARRRDGGVSIAVRDTGIGISSDVLPKVFDLFMQADRSAGRSQGGLGIGLTLVKSLVEMHGGTVEARSEGVGRGSEFVVHLPTTEAPAPAAANRAIRSAPAFTRCRVLVVDDNRDSADSLGHLLKLLGAEVHVIYESRDALAAFEQFRPGFVLLDIGMPGMDGYEVARRIRKRPDARGVTLIALTGWGQLDDRRRSRSAGFDHHLTKPTDASALESLLIGREADASGTET